MRYLYNLSIRKKFAVVIVPLIITIVCFDYLQIRDSYLDYNDALRLNRAILLGVEINHVVHELQRERSISSGYIANQGQDFSSNLDEQREKTDSTIQQFYSELIKPEFKGLLEIHGDDLERLRSHGISTKIFTSNPRLFLRMFSRGFSFWISNSRSAGCILKRWNPYSIRIRSPVKTLPVLCDR